VKLLLWIAAAFTSTVLSVASDAVYFDGESGKGYNYHRNLDPSTGRYLESDPIGLRGGKGTFTYVHNQPLRLVDPFGLKARVCCRQLGWLPASHCFIQEAKDDPGTTSSQCDSCPSKDRTLGLQGPPKWGTSRFPDAGEKKINDGFDVPDASSCGDWVTNCSLSDCLDKQFANYANPSVYSAVLGPNSNTFASTLASACGLGGSVGFWPTPGWGQPPATAK